MKTIKLRYILPMVTLLIGLVAIAAPAPSPAQALVVPDPDKVTICHRSDSASNPYQHNSVAKSAVNGGGVNDHSQDIGPIAYSQAYAQQLKDAKPKEEWGDIIPPFDTYEGLNWTALGRAMWENDCNFVTAVVPANLTFVTPTCQTLGSYTIPATMNVEYGLWDDKNNDGFKQDGEINVIGAGTYTVANGTAIKIDARAIKGYYFTNGTTESWSNTFTTPDCNVVPAAVTFTAPTCSVLGTYVVPTTANVTYKLGANTVAAGSYNAANGSTVKVDAVANTNYTIKTGATTTWSNTFTAPANCTGTLGSSTTSTTTTTSTPAVAGASTTQVTSTPTGSVDTGSADNGILALAGFIFSAGLVGASALLKQRVF